MRRKTQLVKSLNIKFQKACGSLAGRMEKHRSKVLAILGRFCRKRRSRSWQNCRRPAKVDRK